MTGRHQAPQEPEERRNWFAPHPGQASLARQGQDAPAHSGGSAAGSAAPHPGQTPASPFGQTQTPAAPSGQISAAHPGQPSTAPSGQTQPPAAPSGQISAAHPGPAPAAPTGLPSAATSSGPAAAPHPEDNPDITLMGRLPNARPAERRRSRPPMPGDRLVWPPPPPDDRPDEDESEEDRSTQPFAAIRNEALPLSARPGYGGPPASPAPAGPEPAAAAPAGPGPASAETGDSPRRRARGAAAPRSSRHTTLIAVGAVIASALALGLPAWSGYTAYKYGRPDYAVHTVDAGQSRTLQHVAWEAEIAKTENPSGAPTEPGRQWLRITVFRTPVDEEGVRRSGRPEFDLRDRQGRTWAVTEIAEEPPLPEDQRPGVTYRYELFAEVPMAVADEVELHLRPSLYRSSPDRLPADLMKEAVNSTEREEVLRFKR